MLHLKSFKKKVLELESCVTITQNNDINAIKDSLLEVYDKDRKQDIEIKKLKRAVNRLRTGDKDDILINDEYEQEDQLFSLAAKTTLDILNNTISASAFVKLERKVSALENKINNIIPETAAKDFPSVEKAVVCSDKPQVESSAVSSLEDSLNKLKQRVDSLDQNEGYFGKELNKVNKAVKDLLTNLDKINSLEEKIKTVENEIDSQIKEYNNQNENTFKRFNTIIDKLSKYNLQILDIILKFRKFYIILNITYIHYQHNHIHILNGKIGYLNLEVTKYFHLF